MIQPRVHFLAAAHLAAFALIVPAGAYAQEPHSSEEDAVQRARDAYDRGARAYDEGRYAEAAEAFAEADALVPKELVLELAIKSALRAGLLERGLELVGRAEERHATGTLATVAASARRELEARLGDVALVCADGHTCVGAVRGQEGTFTSHRWMRPGTYTIRIEVDGASDERTAVVRAGTRLEIAPLAPASPSAATTETNATLDARRVLADVPRPAPARDGVSPVIFWGSLIGTAALGGLASVSAYDTMKKHDAYLASPGSDTRSDGIASQTRTNVLAGGAVLAGVTTALLGVFFVRWGAPASAPRAAR